MFYNPSGYSGVKDTNCPPGAKINGIGSEGKSETTRRQAFRDAKENVGIQKSV